MKEVQEPQEKSNGTIEQLLNIAREYKINFTTTRKWDDFAKENGLPSSRQYVHHFGSWNKAKGMANLPLSDPTEYHRKYTKEKLVQIIKEHHEHFTSKEEWNEYAKENNLPTYMIFWYHNLFWDEILKIAGKPIKVYTPKELEMIAKNHREHFVTRHEWDAYAEKHNLPKSHLYIKAFTSWNTIKNKVLQLTNEDLLKIAQQHSLANFSRREWDRYAKKHNLPSSFIYLHRIGEGSWNKVKAKIY